MHGAVRVNNIHLIRWFQKVVSPKIDEIFSLQVDQIVEN